MFLSIINAPKYRGGPPKNPQNLINLKEPGSGSNEKSYNYARKNPLIGISPLEVLRIGEGGGGDAGQHVGQLAAQLRLRNLPQGRRPIRWVNQRQVTHTSGDRSQIFFIWERVLPPTGTGRCFQDELGIKPVLGIRDMLARNRGSVPMTNGSGSGSCYFRHSPSRRQKLKKYYILKIFLLITF
jgi:hypothetical protein